MLLNDITYNTVINTVKNWIKNNCINIANWNSIPACFKQGYSNTTVISGNGTIQSTCTINIVKYVSQVSGTTVDTDINNFLNNIGLSNKLNENIDNSEFINFINNIVNFCATRLCFTVSQYSENKYLIYSNLSVTIPKIAMNDFEDFKLTESTDVIEILKCLEDILNKNIRTIPCTYDILLK